ncbi:hypothetical protein F5Y06DRAFT_300089 [Hypoxylon sp. FL0890]|nr:hypothetical protein F5Y06DRAFT_300089 [Hypoxylon sp. FL0890]
MRDNLISLWPMGNCLGGDLQLLGLLGLLGLGVILWIWVPTKRLDLPWFAKYPAATICHLRWVDWILLIGANFYDANILCIKVAILLDRLHIFVPGKTRNKFFWAYWVVLTINTLYYIDNIVAVNLSCIPFEASWNILAAGEYLDQKALDTSSAVINLISDLTIMVLAQQVIWNLHMSLETRQPGFKQLSSSQDPSPR